MQDLEFPGGAVVKTQTSESLGAAFKPQSRNQIPYDTTKDLQATTKTEDSAGNDQDPAQPKKKKKQIHYQALYKKMFAHVHSITIDCLKIRLTFGGKKKKTVK